MNYFLVMVIIAETAISVFVLCTMDKTIAKLRKANIDLIQKNTTYRSDYAKWANNNNIYNKERNYSDIKKAVKYAMKKSHPDEGGNEEDFKKFRKIYEEMEDK